MKTRTVDEFLAALSAQTLPADQREEWWTDIAANMRATTRRSRRRARRAPWRHSGAWLSAAAAVVIAAGGVGWVGHQQGWFGGQQRLAVTSGHLGNLASRGVGGANTASSGPTGRPGGAAVVAPRPYQHAKPLSDWTLPALTVVDRVSADVGFIGGQQLVLATSDGGRTWASVYQATGSQVRSVDFANANDGVIALDHELLLTSDGGRTWASVGLPGNGQSLRGTAAQAQGQQAPTDQQLFEEHRAQSISGGHAYVLEQGALWYYAGGGEWVLRTPTAGAPMLDSFSFVRGSGGRVGFAAAHNTVYGTTDGGRTWTTLYSAAVVMNTGGSGGVANPWWSQIRAASANDLWFMVYGGDAGMSQQAYIVYHSTDGGRSWTPVWDEGYFSNDYPQATLPPAQEEGAMQPGPLAVFGTSAWLVGYDANGGDHLSVQRSVSGALGVVNAGAFSPTVPDYFAGSVAMSFANATDGWIVGTGLNQATLATNGGMGGNGALLATADGGRTWTPVS